MCQCRRSFWKRIFAPKASSLSLLKKITFGAVTAGLAISAHAAQIHLAWDPPTNANGMPITTLAGYKLYYGLSSQTYPANVTVGNHTTFTLDGLEAGTTYYFAVTAYDQAGLESEYSEELRVTMSVEAPAPAPAPAPTPPPTPTTPPGPTYRVSVWLEAEAGEFHHALDDAAALQPIIEVGIDDTASASAYVWTADNAADVLDPVQPGATATYRLVVPAASTYVLWGRVLPSPDGLGSFFVNISPWVVRDLGAVSALTPTSYALGTPDIGSPYYTDRSYTIRTMPATLHGLTAIKTKNNDKANTQATLLTFTLSRDAILYVAYDSRATRYPSWLTAAYTRTGETIQTTDTPLTVWRRDVKAGEVTLPGNLYGNPAGVGSNYLVLLAFAEGALTADDYHLWDIATLTTEITTSFNVTSVSPTGYRVGLLNHGVQYYVDRSYTIRTMPEALRGLTAVQTKNNDKSNAQETFLTFTINHEATLYVAYDGRATRYPAWLTSAYTPTGETILTTDTPLTVWRRNVQAGQVRLPGNLHGNPAGVGSNYIVLLASIKPTTAWSWQEVNDLRSTDPIHFSLESGEYTLTIKQREAGAKLDRLLITNDLQYVPQGLGARD